MQNVEERIGNLNTFLQLLDEWDESHSKESRAQINRTKNTI